MSCRRELYTGRGNAALEFALLSPWFIYLFLGIFDYGFYAYSLIAVQNGARAAAIYTSASFSSASDSTTACRFALAQLADLPNVGSASTCSGAVSVTASLVNGPDGGSASSVTVSYQTTALFQIPLLFPGQISISRTVMMRTRS